jgi:hypothetical protein
MEDIFEKKKKKYVHLVVPSDLADKLKTLGKGSYTQIIRQLVEVNTDRRVLEDIKDLKKQVYELENKLQLVVQLNKLHFA